MAIPEHEDINYSSYVEDEDNSAKTNPYTKIQRIQEKRARPTPEQIKESHRPKQDKEEYDNLKIPKELKNQITVLEEELRKRNKENKAIAYALGIANDTIEKLQKDLLELTLIVKELKEDANLYLNEEDEDEKLLNKSYDSKVDIDRITNDILFKLQDELPALTQPQNKKGKFSLEKKELIIYIILILLIIFNPIVQNTIKSIFDFGNKESLSSQYKTTKGDYAVCTTKNDSTQKKFALKEDTLLNVEKTNDGKIWFIIGEYSCYKDSLNKN